MSRIFKDSKTNLYVYIYTNDHQPARVHIFCNPKRSNRQPGIKISIGSETQRPTIVMKHPSITNKDAIAALKLVAEHQQEFLERWHEIHG
ncbi:MAG: DUF4160 domain-containing protein [Limnospira sp.]